MSAVAAIQPQAEVTSAEAYAARLYERHSRAIFGLCLRQLRRREDADDAVQTTFIYALLSLRRGVIPQMELPWLIAIAKNVCSTRRRSGMRRGAYETPHDLDTIQDKLATPDRSDVATSEDFRAALSAIPESQRTALLLREWKGLSYDEIGTELGLSQAATEALLFRARQNVAQKLGGKAGRATFNGLPFISFLRNVFQTAAAKTVAVGAGAALTIAAAPAAERQQPRDVSALHANAPVAQVHQSESRTSPLRDRTSPHTHVPARRRDASLPADHVPPQTSVLEPAVGDATPRHKQAPPPTETTAVSDPQAPPASDNEPAAPAPLETVGDVVQGTASDVTEAVKLPEVSLPTVTTPPLPVSPPPLPVQLPDLPSSLLP
jgi:RNA polymerase sigma-70 factor (ECF subfamily)